MKQTCNKPCPECPFRKDSAKGWLGPWHDAEELHRYVMSEQHLACHMTVKEDGVDDGTVEHCVGSVQYMLKNFKMPRDRDLALILKRFKDHDESNIMNGPEFLKHHGKR